MLKIVFYTQDSRLKVRLAHPDDPFTKACVWKDKLQFIVSDNGDFMMLWTSLLPDLEPEYAEALVDLVGSRYPLSPSYGKLRDTCPSMIFKNNSNEWVFFGGTFNPWHQGHQACLNLLPDDLPCLILPDRNPQKELRDLSPVGTLLEISTKARFKKCQFLVPTFLMIKEKNPTVTWVERLKEEMPSLKISLLMGFDSFSTLKSWVRSADLLSKIHTLYVVSRLEDDDERAQALDEAHALSSELNVIFLGRHDYEAISSTELRAGK